MKSVVVVERLSKSFKLPHEKHATLKSRIIHPFSGRRIYEKQRVLKNLSFEVCEGEFFGIVGKNGGGKSTLLKLLANIYSPDNGRVHILGKLVPFIELGVGFNPELTGRDNVYLNGALLGFSNKEMDLVYDDIVEFAELEPFMDQKLKNYSSGMQVRLAFSVATRSKADILLVDEVLAVGDASFQRKCYDYFSTLKKAGKTVIFISHDMNAVREYCDRAILIDNGRIIKSGDANIIAQEYLKLFSAATESKGSMAGEKRWGNGNIKLSSRLNKVDAEEIEIKITATATKDVMDQTLGLSIEDSNGAVVWGTNTEILQKKLPPLTKGESLNLTWLVPNIFRDGQYTISVASHGYGGLPVYDWQNNALKLELLYDKASPYVVAPDVKVEIHKGL